MTKTVISGKKDKLRARVLATRGALELDQVEIGAQAILERVLGLEAYRRATLIHAYISSRENEVDTRELIDISLEQGKRVVVPVLEQGKKTMAHALIESLDGLVDGPWGLVQPDLAKATLLEKQEEIDLVVVLVIAAVIGQDFNEIFFPAGFAQEFANPLIGGKYAGGSAEFSSHVGDHVPVHG